MRLSQLFTKTHKEAPKDETSISAQLLLRGGFIQKQMAGAYVVLPLGLRVLNKIINITRQEMNAVGGVELSMTALQPKEPWLATGRWDDDIIDVWFKTKLQNGTEVGLGNTHEEPLTALMREYISSYRDLPRAVYQFQTKFRNELRAKSGIMRTREFIMKDLYSFSRNQAEHDAFYEQMQAAYLRIFDRVGLGDHTYLTFASGGSFAKFSHEFQTVTEAGEDTIYLDKKKKIAINEEVYTDDVVAELGLKKDDLHKVTASEVGNIFTLGTRFSEPLDLKFTDEDGSVKPVVMGCYGLGPARTMGVIAELMHDENGIMWPAAVAPADIHLVRLGDAAAVTKAADDLYADLQDAGHDVLYDDRQESAGAKFADADLIGCPVRLTVSERTIKEKSVEFKRRSAEKVTLVSLPKILTQLT